MVVEALTGEGTDEAKRERDKWLGVYIAVLAVLLALCSMGGGNAAKEATLKNIEAANTWAFFQAKNMRRHVLRVQTDELELQLLSQPAMPEDAKTAIAAKIKAYKEEIARLTSDPKGNEGLDDLFKKGKALEAERDVAMARDPYFDYGQALLQIAIVLASVVIIAGGNMLLGVSAVIAALGALFTFNGFTLLLKIPIIG